jgi:hypothetical protein
MKTDMLRLDPAIDAHCEHAIDVTRPRAKCEPIQRVDRPASSSVAAESNCKTSGGR